jgi:hypothetical protein
MDGPVSCDTAYEHILSGICNESANTGLAGMPYEMDGRLETKESTIICHLHHKIMTMSSRFTSQGIYSA